MTSRGPAELVPHPASRQSLKLRGPQVPRPAHRRDEERPPEFPAAGPGPHGGAAPASRSGGCGFRPRRRM